MVPFIRTAAGLWLASLLFAAPTMAQGPVEGTGSAAYGYTTVTIGGGTALLTLPDVEFAKLRNGTVFLQRLKTSDDFGDEYGWNINGSITVPMTGAQGRPKWLTLGGFWANIEDDDRVTCTSTATALCSVNSIIDNPALADNAAFGAGVTGLFATDRDVDHWGVSLESKWQIGSGVSGVTKAAPRRYVALGTDVRGIDQELSLRANSSGGLFLANYNEDLDTTYYGAYAAWGGDYSLPFFSGFSNRWGLQSSFQLRGGIYYADVDFSGTSVLGAGVGQRQLSLSDSEAAFIGGLVLETRKRIGSRSTLSLKSEYEYYSYVPEMNYNDFDAGIMTGPNIGTSIGDDDAFSARTMLRLTVSLGGHDVPVK